MRILTYRDLESKSSLLPLMEQAFGWPFDPREFEKYVKMDPGLRNGVVGFCGVENGCVVGFVGVMDLATRTLNGTVEYMGGIYGVATLPGHTRRGIAKRLLNSANQYFSKKGYRFSFLNTSPTLVAYALYCKLGYEDVVEYPCAYRMFETQKPASSSVAENSGFDPNKVLKIYEEYVNDKTGFVVRDRAYLRTAMKHERLTARQLIASEKGYVFFRRERGLVRIIELVALDAEEMNRLIGLVEEKARDLVFGRAFLDEALRRVYRSRGYVVLERGHGVLMAKGLTADASIRGTYGRRFYISRLDNF